MSIPVFQLTYCIGCGADFKTTQPGKQVYCGKCLAKERKEKKDRAAARRQRRRTQYAPRPAATVNLAERTPLETQKRIPPAQFRPSAGA